MKPSVFECKDLSIAYKRNAQWLPAVEKLSLSLSEGEIVGIVGESGCGKSTLGLGFMDLLPANAEVTTGDVYFRGVPFREMNTKERQAMHGGNVAMVFQDPFDTLNPTMSIRTQMVDVLRAHSVGKSRRERTARAVEMLKRVRIPDADTRINRFPHEFSGGMRQRIGIAMALMLRPSVLIADEITTALDVTLQIEILALLKELCLEFRTTVLFISHDLGVVAQLCDRVMVMYAGQVVEEGPVESLYARPLHPYTQALFKCLPSQDSPSEQLGVIPGQVPDLSGMPRGCRFAERCCHAQNVCRDPGPNRVAVGGQQVLCTMYDVSSGFSGVRPTWNGRQTAS